MTRWLALALLALAVSGPASAAPREGDVVVFRTSGQPERRLKVLRVSAFPDGESLADVQDEATGDRFTLPGKVLAAAGRIRNPEPKPEPVQVPVAAKPPVPESTIVRVRMREWAPPVVILPASANLPADDATTAPEPSQPPPVPQAQPQPSAEAQMFAEIKPLVADLHTALRPTVREDAATGLAEGRYGSRPEVKATLAYAAMTDPAPSVRAHCIRCLSALGYQHPVYVEFLRACAGSGSGEVQTAAAAALAKLTPRK
jgi:hypothetical protein